MKRDLVSDRGQDRPIVCQVLHSLCVGGAEVLASQFAERSTGVVRTVFACLDDLGELGQRLRDGGAEIEVFARRPGFDFGLTRQLARYFARHRVDVIHAHQYAPFFYSSLARLPGRNPPLIFTEHGRSFPDYRRPKRVFANRFLLGSRDRVIAVGDQVREALIANEGFSPNRVEVIQNGVPVRDYASSPGGRANAREKLGLVDSAFVIVQVARLNALKDHRTAVATMEHLVKTHPNARLLLVGEGEERPGIEAAIAQAGLSKAITLYGSRSDVKTFFHAADAFMLTSVSEGIPLTLVEAMAAGIACVATNVGGIPDVIEHEASGLLAQAGDALALSRHLARLADDTKLRSMLADQGQQRAIEVFSDDAMHQQYQQLYLELSGRIDRTRKSNVNRSGRGVSE
ncbi:glycosyltransferase [Planctomycetaceae bacterium SH139]